MRYAPNPIPQLRNANGRRSGGRHIESAVSAAPRGSSANKRGIAGLAFEKIEFRPTSLRHFLASSSTRIAAVAPTACYGCEPVLHWLRTRLLGETFALEKWVLLAHKRTKGCCYAVVLRYKINRLLATRFASTLQYASTSAPSHSLPGGYIYPRLKFRTSSAKPPPPSIAAVPARQPRRAAQLLSHNSTPPPRGARFRSDGLHAVKSKHGAARS